jgi:hypothetical protein
MYSSAHFRCFGPQGLASESVSVLVCLTLILTTLPQECMQMMSETVHHILEHNDKTGTATSFMVKLPSIDTETELSDL